MAKPSGFSSGFGPGFGVGKYRYSLVPYVWESAHWHLPLSSVGGVDLRFLPQQSAAGGSPQGFAFCASMQPVSGTQIAESLNLVDEDVTTAMQDAWQTAVGFRPAGAKLVDLLWDQLTTGADPTGQAGPKPLMPNTANQLELHLGGHSLVKRERFRWGTHPHTNRVRDVLRHDFEREWERTNGAEHCLKVLGYSCRKYGLRGEAWRDLVPARLRAHVPGPRPPETTLTENFTRADGDTIGNLLTWTEVAGDYDTVSNKARVITSGSYAFARAESDLSGDDHYAQFAVTINDSNAEFFVACRFAAAATTAYLLFARSNDSLYHIYKIVAGSFTQLDANSLTIDSNTYKVQADGSTIAIYKAGADEQTITDSAITGNTRVGMGGILTGGTGNDWDDLLAADLGAAPTTAPPPFHRRTRFFPRR